MGKCCRGRGSSPWSWRDKTFDLWSSQKKYGRLQIDQTFYTVTSAEANGPASSEAYNELGFGWKYHEDNDSSMPTQDKIRVLCQLKVTDMSRAVHVENGVCVTKILTPPRKISKNIWNCTKVRLFAPESLLLRIKVPRIFVAFWCMQVPSRKAYCADTRAVFTQLSGTAKLTITVLHVRWCNCIYLFRANGGGVSIKHISANTHINIKANNQGKRRTASTLDSNASNYKNYSSIWNQHKDKCFNKRRSLVDTGTDADLRQDDSMIFLSFPISVGEAHLLKIRLWNTMKLNINMLWNQPEKYHMLILASCFKRCQMERKFSLKESKDILLDSPSLLHIKKMKIGSLRRICLWKIYLWKNSRRNLTKFTDQQNT